MKKLTEKEKQEARARFQQALDRIKPRDNLLFAVFFLLVAYGLASRALETASLFEYALAFVALGLTISNLIGFTRKKLGKVSS